MSDKAVIGCLVFCVAAMVLSINIPLIYYGAQEQDSICVEGTRGGLDLPTWCILTGATNVGVFGFCLILAFCMPFFEQVSMYLSVTFVVLSTIFNAIMWVWGIIILATNENNNCVAQGENMAIAAIVWLVLGWWGNLGSGIKIKSNE